MNRVSWSPNRVANSFVIPPRWPLILYTGTLYIRATLTDYNFVHENKKQKDRNMLLYKKSLLKFVKLMNFLTMISFQKKYIGYGGS